jgi:CRISPR-associated protein Csm1
MPEQILLQGKILGTEEFLLAIPAEGRSARSAGEDLLAGRSQWITLLCEALPRALLAELGLARILLGSSGGGQFLVVLPGEAGEAAETFLAAAGRQISELSGGYVSLVWGVTDNLGDWAVIRRRLNEQIERRRNAPLAAAGDSAFQPFTRPAVSGADHYFARELGAKVREAAKISWSPENPGKITPGEGKYSWPLTSNLSPDGIMVARHAAPSDDGKSSAPVQTLARRAQGRSTWGVLRGDVDNFGVRLRRVHSIEEHVPLSVLYKQFFAGELEVLCSMPEFWRKVTIVYSGGDDFAVYGAWDALIGLARELRRLFHRFTDENVQEFPGPDGKTLSMALALAGDSTVPFASVYRQAGEMLEAAKSTDKDCFALLGRTLEWRQVTNASDLKDTMTKMVREFGCPPQFLAELASLTSFAPASGATQDRYDKPWRFHRRLNRVLGPTRARELQKMRTYLITEMLGKSAAHAKLRPAGRVAVAWASYLTEVDSNGRTATARS